MIIIIRCCHGKSRRFILTFFFNLKPDIKKKENEKKNQITIVLGKRKHKKKMCMAVIYYNERGI